MPKTQTIKVLLILAGVILCLAHCSTSRPLKDLPTLSSATRPKRVMVLVFDQLRPDLIERFQMKSFLRLQNEGLSFPNAVVGHLGSVTVVSHPVITTGLLPKHLPWQDEFFRDSDGKLGKKGAFYSSLDLSPEQYRRLLSDTAPVSLLSLYRTEKSGSSHTYTLGQKQYAVMGMGAPLSGSVITLSEKLKSPAGWRAPSGFSVPSFFIEPFLGRFYLDCNPTYGSETTLYPMDGNRFAPGNDNEHLGGDAWVADGVQAIMDNDPNWRAIFATFGSIDKVLHALAEHETPTQSQWAIKNHLTLEETLHRADEALNHILNTLEKNGQLEETAIVVTADHGGQANTHFHGITERGQGSNYLFYGKAENKHNPVLPPTLEPLMASGEIEGITHDSALRFWTKKLSHLQLSKLANSVSTLPGVAEVYTLHRTGTQYHYVRSFRSKDLKGRSLDWAEQHNRDLLETIAQKNAPNIVALLFDNHGYGLQGDHGGAQELVQKIPIILRFPNLLPEKRGAKLPNEVRLVDINPMLREITGASVVSGLDGSAKAIEAWVQK